MFACYTNVSGFLIEAVKIGYGKLIESAAGII